MRELERALDVLGGGAVGAELLEDAVVVVVGAGVVEGGRGVGEEVEGLLSGEISLGGVGAVVEEEAGD